MGVVLRSRDYLVDALPFHSAAVRHPVKIRALIVWREACLDEALVWEDLAGCSLLVYDYDGNDAGSTFRSQLGFLGGRGSVVEVMIPCTKMESTATETSVGSWP